MSKKTERRINTSLDENKAYKSLSLSKQINAERRSDNLERLIEIQQQKKVYYFTLGFCIFLNAILLTLGFIGLGGN